MRRGAPGSADSPPEHVTPYDRFAWSDIEIEHLLVTGDYASELIAYFGQREYGELAQLARQSNNKPLADDAPRVFIVPGIMGSQLGLMRQPPLPNDILWLDPIDIGQGRLAALKLSAGQPIVSLGVVLYSYLKLKLHLRAHGLAPIFHDYDWRLGVDRLGVAFAERVRREPGRVMIVAHSMGGLVSRAAMAQTGMDRVERLVLLGTPNFGSFAPLQALRGTYAVVRKIARLVATSSAESLADEVFNSFPSLYHMLPMAHRIGGPDLLDPAQWPLTGPQPDNALMKDALTIQERLAQPDSRTFAVVGVGEETVTAAVKRNDEFVFTITRRGDGTVPAVSAELPGAAAYYAAVAHSDLTRDAAVAAAVTDLLLKGVTRRLPSKWKSRSSAEARISERQLRRTHVTKVDWAALEPDQRREFLQNLNEPPKLKLKAPLARPRRKPARKRAETSARPAAPPPARTPPRKSSRKPTRKPRG